MCAGRGPTAARASFVNGQIFREVGLHQCPSERKGQEVPVRGLHVPSHVPSHRHNAAKVRGFSRTASGFTAETDWLLEEGGFEPLVPLTLEGSKATEPSCPAAPTPGLFQTEISEVPSTTHPFGMPGGGEGGTREGGRGGCAVEVRHRAHRATAKPRRIWERNPVLAPPRVIQVRRLLLRAGVVLAMQRWFVAGLIETEK
jgi:hypothetical protein